MKSSFLSNGSFAACLILLTGCENQSAPPPPQKAAEIPAAVKAANAEGRPGNQSSDNLNERHEYLELILHNNNTSDIDETAIVLGKNPCTFGVVGAKVSKGYLGWEDPVGTNAIVKWRDKDQIKREAQIDIMTTYNREVPGALTFHCRHKCDSGL